METTDAILLRRTKLSDTSWIVTWSTEKHGRIKTVAKGARRPKSTLAGKLDLFFEAEISFVRSIKSELHTLREVVLKNPRDGLRKDIQRVELGAYFVELYELVTEPDHAGPELYDLLRRAFDHLNEQPASKRAMLHFETELTRLLGIQNFKDSTPVRAVEHAYGRLPQGRGRILKAFGS